jgi:hypothetical protein
MAHKFFIFFLIAIGLFAFFAVGMHGFDYYTTPKPERAFRPDYAEMKPSGYFSHGLGVIGGTMITVGVALYSSRKRIRALWNLGRLSSWLEFHIFLCLVGPVLVIYHTTFKAGGIAAISLWTMLSVAASGIVGRFLYVLIPRNIKGGQLTSQQINEEFDRLAAVLRESELGSKLLSDIDKHFAAVKRPETFWQTVTTYFSLMKSKRQVRRALKRLISKSNLSPTTARTLYKAASSRASLIRRSIVLLQAEKLFYYWHAIHLPFSVIMFITLAVHIGVAIWLGYSWIF